MSNQRDNRQASPNAADDFEIVPPQTARLGKILTNTGIGVLRYSLVAILLYYGSFKFHSVEAQAIQPLIANSPFMSWMYSVLSIQAVSNLIGTAEIIFAVLILELGRIERGVEGADGIGSGPRNQHRHLQSAS